MKIILHGKAEIRDQSGKLLCVLKWNGESYVIAFLDILSSHFANAARTITDTGGTARSVTTGALDFRGPVNDSTQGIVVGTGTNAVAIGDTKLQTQITHGAGAGQLSHGLQSFVAPSTTGSTRSYTTKRLFTNNSGGTITVQESGIYSTTSSFRFCVIRDLTGAVAILNTQVLTLEYTIGITA